MYISIKGNEVTVNSTYISLHVHFILGLASNLILFCYIRLPIHKIIQILGVNKYGFFRADTDL